MTLLALLSLPLVGAVLVAVLGRGRPQLARWITVATLVVALSLSLGLCARPASEGGWRAELDLPWIPQLSARLHLALDGLSLPLVVLTFALGLVAVVASWTEIRHRVAFFHANVLCLLTGVVGVFLAMDLVLFYAFWELMLVPMVLVIGIWGHERRVHAALKFFVFTQAGSLLLLVALLGLHLAHLQATGQSTFDLPELLGTPLDRSVERALMLGFLLAFATKFPMFPLHPWLPDAHTEAPTGGSVLLAGLLLKTGAYGLIRFVVPLFPRASAELAPVVVAFGLVGVLYGGWLAFAQTDAKRLVAYSSVSHMGFVVMAIFAWNRLALQGALLEMVAHALSTGALFVVVGALDERLGTRDLRELGGLWSRMPRLGVATLVFSLGALGLPGLANFPAEFLCLLGVWQAFPGLAAAGAAGLVLAAVYALWLVQRTFHGPLRRGGDVVDLRGGELGLHAAMALALVWLGLAPQPLFDLASGSLARMLATTGGEGVVGFGTRGQDAGCRNDGTSYSCRPDPSSEVP